MSEEAIYLQAAGMAHEWQTDVLGEANDNLGKIVALGVLPSVTETEQAVFDAGVFAGMNSTLALLIRKGLLPGSDSTSSQR